MCTMYTYNVADGPNHKVNAISILNNIGQVLYGSIDTEQERMNKAHDNVYSKKV